MASDWRGFGIEYFEQFALVGTVAVARELAIGLCLGLGQRLGSGLGLEWVPIWVIGESRAAKGFSLISEKGGGAWRLLGGAMGNWTPSDSRLASLLVVLMGAASAVRVLVLFILFLRLLVVCGAVEALFSVLVLVSCNVLVLISVSVLLVAPLAAAARVEVNSPMCGGRRSSAGRRISVIPEAYVGISN